MACVRFGKCRPADLTALFPRQRGLGQGSAARRGKRVFDFPRGECFGLDEPKLDQAGDELMVKQRRAGPGFRSQVIQEVAFGRRQVHDRGQRPLNVAASAPDTDCNGGEGDANPKGGCAGVEAGNKDPCAEADNSD